jgi:hypothetical protein
VVHQAQGRRAVLLDEVDLDGRALGRHAHPAVLPAVGEDEPSVRDQLHEPADDRGAEIPGEHPRLEGDGRLVRAMRFGDLDQLEAGRADLEAAIRAWCDWKADPSKPG